MGRFSLSKKKVTGDNTETTPTEPEVVVAENTEGEAKNETTKDGQTDPVENTESVPQNGVTTIETSEEPTESDKDRTEDEVKFADESNPNQKARTTSAGGAEYDQDGNLRTDGYSYGVAPDDTRGVNEDSFKENVGEKPEESKERFDGNPVHVADNRDGELNSENANADRSPEEVAKLEKELSNEKEGLVARVITASDNYTKVKWFKDNKPFVTYKALGKFDKKDAKAFLKDAQKNG